MEETELDDWVPRLRRCPDSVDYETWTALVRGMFPVLSPEDYELVSHGSDPALFRFEVRHRTGTPHDIRLRGTEFGENQCDCASFRYGIYGTCPHIEFALSRLRELHGDSFPEILLRRPYSEIFLHRGARHKILFQPAANAPRAVLSLARRCFDKQGELILSHLAELQRLIQYAPTFHHEILIEEEVFEMIAFLTQKQWRMRDILASFSKGTGAKAFEKLLKTTLTSFQREAALNAAIAGRYLLFSMSGLGKRRTAIAAAEILAQNANLRHVLILTETELLQTWRHELLQTTDRKTEVVFGSTPNRSRLYAGDAFFKIARYDDFREDFNAILGSGPPNMLIYDEAQTIKRHDVETVRLLRRLDSEYLLILSGSDPVRIPGPFLSFVDRIDSRRTGLLESFLNRHQSPSPDIKAAKYVNMNRLQTTLTDYYRRDETRTYRQNLPEIIEHFRFLPLTAEQGALHASLQSQLFRAFQPWKEASRTPPIGTLHLIQTLLLKMFYAANDSPVTESNTSPGHKVRVLQKILGKHTDASETRVLVFAHHPALLDIIARELEQARQDYAAADRRMSVTQLKMSIRKFEQEPNCRILLTSDGLPEKLPVGNVHVVIHWDRPWNPDIFRERNQHLSRSPIRPVHAYHLISHGTVEHACFKAADKIDIKIPLDLIRNQSVTLLEASQWEKFFEQVKIVLENLTDAPMIVPAT
ncbi:MAG: DEAD/DEAH box helicase [Planctomycetaceae bacterium]|nr:DEAD/DEAH box helicase [Planctomycetaceae bacterium]